jgi:hypothetical protein
VPERYREPDRARQLMSVVMDAVVRGGTVVLPANEPSLHEAAREAGCELAVFAPDERDALAPHAAMAAWIARDRIVLASHDASIDAGPLRRDAPAVAQLAAAVALQTAASRASTIAEYHGAHR